MRYETDSLAIGMLATRGERCGIGADTTGWNGLPDTAVSVEHAPDRVPSQWGCAVARTGRERG